MKTRSKNDKLQINMTESKELESNEIDIEAYFENCFICEMTFDSADLANTIDCSTCSRKLNAD